MSFVSAHGHRYRRILRSVAVPPTKFPDRYRASTLSWWFWCAERSRHYALNLIPKRPPSVQSKQGTELHDDILTQELGHRFPWEDEFMEALESVQDAELGFSRKIGNADVYDNVTGHADDFQVSLDGDVTILEHKTTEIKPKQVQFIERYRLPTAEFQLKIYCWIFSDVLKKLQDYRLARTHAVLYWYVDRKALTCQLINVYPFTYYPVSVEADIRYALEAYKDPVKILPPREWKCRQCPKVNKEVCRFRGQTT